MNIKCILDKDMHRINDIEDLEPVPIGCESVHFVHFEIAMHILHFGNKSVILYTLVSVIAL